MLEHVPELSNAYKSQIIHIIHTQAFISLFKRIAKIRKFTRTEVHKAAALNIDMPCTYKVFHLELH